MKHDGKPEIHTFCVHDFIVSSEILKHVNCGLQYALLKNQSLVEQSFFFLDNLKKRTILTCSLFF